MEDKFVAIGQFDGSVNLLKINLSTGQAYMLPTDDVDEEYVSFGMFEAEGQVPDSNFVALLATPEGPLLFLKNLQYRPDIKGTKIKIKDDERFSHFLVCHEGCHIFGLFYEKKFGIGLHPYNKSREDIDFYYWLSKHVNNPKLYQTYTKEMHILSK